MSSLFGKKHIQAIQISVGHKHWVCSKQFRPLLVSIRKHLQKLRQLNHTKKCRPGLLLWILILVQEVEIHGLLSPDGRVEDECRCSKKSIRCKGGCLGFQWRPYDSSSKAINISWRYCFFWSRSHNPPWTQLFKILNVIMAFCFTATSETLNCLLKLNQNFLLYPLRFLLPSYRHIFTSLF